MNAHYSMNFITVYLYIISELQFYISFNILLDNEVMETSKRRSFLPLIFIIKSIIIIIIIIVVVVVVVVVIIIIIILLLLSFVSFHVQPVVPVILVKQNMDTLPLASLNISPLTNIKHLRGSKICHSLCLEDCFKILDSSTSFQLKIK